MKGVDLLERAMPCPLHNLHEAVASQLKQPELKPPLPKKEASVR
jgi:hypothetical protein